MKLKKAIAIIAISILASQSINAHTPLIDGGKPDKLLTIGLRAGMTTSNISDNATSWLPQIAQYNVFWRSGICVGMTANLALNNFFSIKTGCNFQSRSYDVTAMAAESKAQSMNSSYTHSRYYYINVPIMLCATLNLGESARLSCDLGVYFAHGLGGTCSRTSFYYRGSDTGDNFFGTNYHKNDYFGYNPEELMSVKRPDIGIVMGVELTVLKHYCVGAHYEAGVKNVAMNSVEEPGKHSLKNQAWRFTLGYNF